MKVIKLVFISLVAASAAFPQSLPPNVHAPWDALLKEFVNERHFVDYARLKQDGWSRLNTYVSSLGQARTQPLSQNEKKALLINAYNAFPVEAENLKNPLPKDGQVIGQRQQLYLQSCALCHGTDGHGRTELGRGMYPPAMDLTSPHVQHWTDAELFWIIQNGVRLTGMPSWKSSISNTDTWKLTRFIHDLPRLDAQAEAQAATGKRQIETQESQEQLIQYGRTLYRQEGCFMCHQLNGEGGKVGPDLSVEGSRGRTSG